MDVIDSLSPDLPSDSKLLVLRNLKNSLIGHRERKLELIRSGSLLECVSPRPVCRAREANLFRSVVELASGEGIATREGRLAIRTEVITIIGAVSMRTSELPQDTSRG